MLEKSVQISQDCMQMYGWPTHFARCYKWRLAVGSQPLIRLAISFDSCPFPQNSPALCLLPPAIAFQLADIAHTDWQ